MSICFRVPFLLGSFAFLLAACAPAAGPAKTEVLPNDGGDLGNAYFELAAAMKASDSERAARLLTPTLHMANKPKSWFGTGVFDSMDREQPAGGRVQGNRATLFLVNKAGNPLEFRYISATRTASSWQFDTYTDFGSSFSKSEARDCTTSKVFPCGTKTAPNSAVTGTISPRQPLPDTPASHRVIDGLAVRMVDAKKQAAGTRVLLSIHGINPEAVALSPDPDVVKGWLAWPLLRLDIAPDGKSAKLEYYDGASRKTGDITKGLSIEAGSPGRVRGKLKAEVEKTDYDLSFDLDQASTCQVDAYRCGLDAP